MSKVSIEESLENCEKSRYLIKVAEPAQCSKRKTSFLNAPSFFRFYLSFLPIVLFSYSYSQEKESLREFVGSFRFKNDIYIYTCQVSKVGATLKTQKITNTQETNVSSLKNDLKKVKQVLSDRYLIWGGNEGDTSILLSKVDSIESNLTESIDKIKEANDVLNSLSSASEALISSTTSDSIKAEINTFRSLLEQIKNITGKLEVDTPVPVPIPWTVEALKGTLLQQLRSSNKDINLADKDLGDLALQIFYKGEAVRDFVDDAPVTANLKLLSDRIKAYVQDVPLKEVITKQKYDELNNRATNEKDKKLKRILEDKLAEYKILDTGSTYIRRYKKSLTIYLPVDKVQIEFDKGTIKNIIATFITNKVIATNKDIVFRNNMPISISGKFDPGFLVNYKIFAYSPKFIQDNYDSQIRDSIPKGSTFDVDYRQEQNVYLKLDELIDYNITLENNKEDYSPADATHILTPIQPTLTLTKQLRSRLLTVKAFTDFMGVNNDQPNGLIQFEANLNANFLTRRIQRLALWHSNFVYQGFFTHADVNAMLTKIEEKNKFLVLGQTGTSIDSMQLSQGKKAFFVSPIDLYQYKSNAIDFTLGLYKVNFPQLKSNFQFDGKFGISRSGVSDSLFFNNNSLSKGTTPSERLVTFTESTVSLLYEFTTDSRYGFNVGLSNTWMNILSEDVSRFPDMQSQIRTFFITGFFATSESSSVFFRWRLNYQADNKKRNFNQVQLGYLVDVFGSRSGSRNKQ